MPLTRLFHVEFSSHGRSNRYSETVLFVCELVAVFVCSVSVASSIVAPSGMASALKICSKRIKLCVGCDSVEELAAWQAERLRLRRKAGEKKPRLFHRTFQTPKRREELIEQGLVLRGQLGALTAAIADPKHLQDQID